MKRGGFNEYKPPLTGFESHISGMDIFRNRMFQNDVKKHQDKLRNMKSVIDTSVPKSSQMKHMLVNRKKKEMEFQRFSAIERENYRLLDKMSKIMVRNAADSIFGGGRDALCPALDGERIRRSKAKQVVEENQILLRRILKTKPYYSSRDWDKHTDKTHYLMEHMCKYPNQVFRPLTSMSRADTTSNASVSNPNESRESVSSYTSGGRKKKLGMKDSDRSGAVSAPPTAPQQASEKLVIEDEGAANRPSSSHAGKRTEGKTDPEPKDNEDLAGYGDESFEAEAPENKNAVSEAYADESFEADPPEDPSRKNDDIPEDYADSSFEVDSEAK